MILIIDHYDSFIDMICDYIATLNYKYELIKTDDIKLPNLDISKYSHVIIGPGPGHPKDQSLNETYKIITKSVYHKIPLLGICLGHQMIGAHFGIKINTATKICHGIVDKLIVINNSKIFKGLPKEFNITRYHSLLIDNQSLKNQSKLVIIGNTLANEIMAVQHYELDVYGVQFHPESIMTEYGDKILANFLQIESNKIS